MLRSHQYSSEKTFLNSCSQTHKKMITPPKFKIDTKNVGFSSSISGFK